MKVGAVAHINDAHVLEFIKAAHGGSIVKHGQTESCLKWLVGVGKQNRSFALSFLPNLVRHSRLKKHKIERMIHHHQQRLSVLSPTG
jgi:hypothetical protein